MIEKISQSGMKEEAGEMGIFFNFYERHIKIKIQIINNNKPSYIILNRYQTLLFYYLFNYYSK